MSDPLSKKEVTEQDLHQQVPNIGPPAYDTALQEKAHPSVLPRSDSFIFHAKSISNMLLTTSTGSEFSITTRSAASTPGNPSIKIHNGPKTTDPVAATVEFETAVGEILMNLIHGDVATTALQQTGSNLTRGYVLAMAVQDKGEVMEWHSVRVNRDPEVVGWRLVRAATGDVMMEYTKSGANVHRRIGEAKWTAEATEAGVTEGEEALLIVTSLVSTLVREERLDKGPKIPTKEELKQLGSAWTIGNM